MARIEKTIFISYRRTDVYTALAVYENLKNQGYDIFFDYRSIASGDFEQVISSNIRARAHFILILTPTALDRCNEPGDWLRREIELAIDEKRNIVPLFFKGFRFGGSSTSGISKWLRFGKPEVLTGKLGHLTRYNGLNVHEDYFDEAMVRLRTEYLNKPLDTVLHPVSTQVRKVVKEEQDAADEALKQKEVSREPTREVDEAREDKKELPKPVPSNPEKKKGASPAPIKAIPWRKVGGIAGALTLIALCLWGSLSLWNSLSLRPEPTEFSRPTATQTLEPGSNSTLTKTTTPKPVKTNTPSPTEPALGIGSTMTGKDGMTLLYVPAGEFTMGSEDGNSDERPVHTVYLDAFWIDQTEVTNAMYAQCVTDGQCDPPSTVKSYTHDGYYGNSEFDNYPVISVSWDDANKYCSWADRRLPTEAEWEKAARGENAHVYPWGDTFNGSLVNFCDTNCSKDWKDEAFDDGYEDTSPVGSYPNGASPYGVLDMAGNVWEWGADWYDAYPGNTEVSSNFGTTYRVLRGGSWVNIDYYVRSAVRKRFSPTAFDNGIGFRCAMDAE